MGHKSRRIAEPVRADMQVSVAIGDARILSTTSRTGQPRTASGLSVARSRRRRLGRVTVQHALP
jgi:hypothetical protein